MKSRFIRLLACLGLLLIAASLLGCSGVDSGTPDLGLLYGRIARYTGPQRNPIIVIPGFNGSRLEEAQTGRVVWGEFGGSYANPQTPDGVLLAALPLRGAAVAPHISATKVLDRLEAKLLGLPLHFKIYDWLLGVLGVGGYRDQQQAGHLEYGGGHFTCFQFAYDFRADIAESARHLHAFIEQNREYVKAEMLQRHGVVDADVRFDIVAHSLGGLLARYYLRYGDQPLPDDGSTPPVTWAGARYVDRAILIAPPNAGAVGSIQNLVQGTKHAPFLPRYEAAVIGSFPSAYQLLPRPRHGGFVDTETGSPIGDIYDPTLWRRLGWGLMDPEQDATLTRMLPDVADRDARRQIAFETLTRHLRRARQMHAALDTPASPPPGTELILIAGNAEPTPSKVGVDPASGDVTVLERAPGDGSVLRSSALLDERLGGQWQPRLVSPIAWHDALFFASRHLGLTKNPALTDNLLYRLLEAPRPPRTDSSKP